MGEKVEDQIENGEINNVDITFNNLTIMKELSNIVNLVGNDDFLETVPKSKLRRVKWVPMFNCLKEGILDEMLQELNLMWEYENMPQKLEVLEKQKEKFSDTNTNQILWRPQLGDVKGQLEAIQVADLRKQKIFLESLAKEYESKIISLKKTLTAKRGYLRALLMDMQKFEKKNEEFISKLNTKFISHTNLCKVIMPNKMDVDKICWFENDLERDE